MMRTAVLIILVTVYNSIFVQPAQADEFGAQIYRVASGNDEEEFLALDGWSVLVADEITARQRDTVRDIQRDYYECAVGFDRIRVLFCLERFSPELERVIDWPRWSDVLDINEDPYRLFLMYSAVPETDGIHRVEIEAGVLRRSNFTLRDSQKSSYSSSSCRQGDLTFSCAELSTQHGSQIDFNETTFLPYVRTR